MRLQRAVVYWKTFIEFVAGETSLPSITTMSEFEFSICPLTFWKICESEGVLMSSMLEHDAAHQKWLGQSKMLRVLARICVLPLYYHLLTSGYGAFVGEELAGWLYLRGWRQILYVETLATHPNWRRQGIAKALLEFAEEKAVELHRRWMGLTVTGLNEAAISLYEKQGYRRAHWRVLCYEQDKMLKIGGDRVFQLRPALGLTANRAYHHFSTLDLAAGDEWNMPVSTRLLEFDPHHQSGKAWLIVIDDQSVAYLHKHGCHTHPNLYLACGPDWWGDLRVLAAIGAALDGNTNHAETITLRLASSGHHDAVFPLLAEMGFVTKPSIWFKMFKYMGQQDERYSTRG
ncbi:MAG: GNAT family N-acetyltransferase [Anaerolineae bacterium]|nr:GNAT family N-acetyltransferase [Anaerolineae bacterium]